MKRVDIVEKENGNVDYKTVDLDEDVGKGTNGINIEWKPGTQQSNLPPAQWQRWMLTTLEEHRNYIAREIASQFQEFRNTSSDDLVVSSLLAPLSESEGAMRNLSTNSPSEALTAVTKCSKGTGSHAPRRLRRLATSFSACMNQQDYEEIRRVADSIKDKAMTAQLPSRSKTQEQIGFEISKVLGITREPDEHPKLDMLIAVAIVMNVVSMMFELEWESYKSQVDLGWIDDTHDWQFAKLLFKIIDHIFNAIFVLECCFRVYLDRIEYFKFKLNLLDFLLVTSASIQIYILEPSGATTGEKLTLFRVIRFIRFVRILKVMKLKAFADLRVLVKTCISSLAALLWSMVLLFLIIIMSGLFLCSLLKAPIQDNELDMDTRVWLYRHYGSSARAAYTLFEVTLAGCWPTYFRPLIEKISYGYGIFAVLYITLVVFAVIRIITAIFLKQTLQVANSDAEMMVNEQRIQTQKNSAKLKGVFEAVDVTGKGVLTFDDFMGVASNPDVRAWLQNFELAVHDVEGLFFLLDDGDGEITYDEFIQGIMRLKGQARSLDVVAIGCHCDKIEAEIHRIAFNIDHMLTSMRSVAQRPSTLRPPSTVRSQRQAS